MPKHLKTLHETARLIESSSTATGRKLVQLISPGWGSSGYYSTEVLEQAAADVVIPKGTHMYADHPTEEEAESRPGRSIKDLMSVTIEDARLATDAEVAAGADPGALVAEVRIGAPYRDLIKDFGDVVGVSIRGDATDIPLGEAEGRSGRIIEGLAHVQSVDWVTKAGRGGKVLALAEHAIAEARNVGQWVESRIHRDFTVLADDMAGEGRLTREERIQLSSAIGDALAAFVANLESAAPQLYQRDIWADPADTVGAAMQEAGPAAVLRRAIARGVEEATVNDTREALYTATRAEYGSDEVWVWVRDFDDSTVWFDLEGDENGTYAQEYTDGDDGSVALTGDRTPVRVVTTYVPATRPDGTTTEESKEDTMGKIQIEESEHTALSEKAGRVDALVTENASLKAKNTELEEAAAKSARTDRARVLVTERAAAADVAFSPLEVKGLVVDLPIKEGALDEEAFTKDVDEAAAAKKAAGGAGSIHGFGGAPAAGQHVSEADFDARFGKKGA